MNILYLGQTTIDLASLGVQRVHTPDHTIIDPAGNGKVQRRKMLDWIATLPAGAIIIYDREGPAGEALNDVATCSRWIDEFVYLLNITPITHPCGYWGLPPARDKYLPDDFARDHLLAGMQHEVLRRAELIVPQAYLAGPGLHAYHAQHIVGQAIDLCDGKPIYPTVFPLYPDTLAFIDEDDWIQWIKDLKAVNHGRWLTGGISGFYFYNGADNENALAYYLGLSRSAIQPIADLRTIRDWQAARLAHGDRFVDYTDADIAAFVNMTYERLFDLTAKAMV